MNSDINGLQRRKSERNHDEVVGHWFKSTGQRGRLMREPQIKVIDQGEPPTC